jgi:hypothetical protein
MDGRDPEPGDKQGEYHQSAGESGKKFDDEIATFVAVGCHAL